MRNPGVTAIALSLAGIIIGLLLGRDVLPGLAVQKQHDEIITRNTTVTNVIYSYDGISRHDERITTNTTVMTVIHSNDGIPQHEHIITVITTTNETTPDGNFYNFTGTASATNLTPVAPPPGGKSQ